MTEENYQYRTSQSMLRNQFPGEGTFQVPIIPKAIFSDGEFNNLLLIGFDRAQEDDDENRDRMVHFSCMITNLNGYGKNQNRIWIV